MCRYSRAPLGPLHTRDREPVTITLSSALIGGKGRAGPSSLLHTTLEGPWEYVVDVKFIWVFTWHRMGHVSWSFGLF